MNRLLVVFNTCGLSNRCNVGSYLNSINSILNQDLDGIRVVLSSCMNQPNDIGMLQSQLGDSIDYNLIHEILPVNVTFNHTVLECVKRHGQFEGYVYIDSGIDFQEQTTAIRKLYELYQSGPYGMVSSRVDRDTGFETWFDSTDYGESLFKNGEHLLIPLGKTVNLHVQIFHAEMLSAYGGLMPDIFAGQCTESVFSFLCAAIDTKFIVHKDVVLLHNTAMDGGSFGFSPHQWEVSGRKRYDHPFGISGSIVDIVQKGAEFGMGYEELQGILLHDPSKFDEDGFAIDNRLKPYIRDNLFLNKDVFDYDAVNNTFM